MSWLSLSLLVDKEAGATTLNASTVKAILQMAIAIIFVRGVAVPRAG